MCDLLPNLLQIAVKLDFTDSKKFFVTQNTSVKPILHIDEAKLYVMACLLDPPSLMRINARLAQGNGLQVSERKDQNFHVLRHPV